MFSKRKISNVSVQANLSVDSPSFCPDVLNTVCLKSSKNLIQGARLQHLLSFGGGIYPFTLCPRSSMHEEYKKSAKFKKIPNVVCKVLKEKKEVLVNVLLNGFHFCGQTTGFQAATRKLELHTKQYVTLRLFS